MAVENVGGVSISLDMIGNASARIKQVGSQLSSLAGTARKVAAEAGKGLASGFTPAVNGIKGQFRGLSDEVKYGLLPIATGSMLAVGRMVQAQSQQVLELGKTYFRVLGGIGAAVLGVAANFESAEAQIRFAFGDKTQQVMKKALLVAERTAFKTKEVFGLVASLGRFHVDPFTEVRGKGGGTMTALEALQDVAAATGQALPSVKMALQNFLSGTTFKQAILSARRRLDLVPEALKKIKDGFADAATPQEKFALFAGAISESYGGMGEKLSHTFAAIVANIGDVRDKLFAAIGTPALKGFTKLALAVKDWLNELAARAAEGGGLAKVFTQLAKVASVVGLVMLRLVKFAVRVIEVFPTLTAVGVTLTSGLVAMTMAAAALIVTVIAIGSAALVTAGAIKLMQLSFKSLAIMSTKVLLPALAKVQFLLMSRLPMAARVNIATLSGLTKAFYAVRVAAFAAFSTIATALAPFWPVILGVTAAVGLLVSAWNRDFGGMRTTVERIVATFSALRSLFKSLNSDGVGFMSLEQHKELKRLGLVQFVTDLFSGIENLRRSFEALADGFSEAFSAALDAAGWLDNTEKSVKGLDDALGVVETPKWLEALNQVSPEQWREFGKEVGKVVGVTIKLADAVVSLAEAFESLSMAFSHPVDTAHAFGLALTGEMDRAADMLNARGKGGSGQESEDGGFWRDYTKTILPAAAGPVVDALWPTVTHEPSARKAQEAGGAFVGTNALPWNMATDNASKSTDTNQTFARDEQLLTAIMSKGNFVMEVDGREIGKLRAKETAETRGRSVGGGF